MNNLLQDWKRTTATYRTHIRVARPWPCNNFCISQNVGLIMSDYCALASGRLSKPSSIALRGVLVRIAGNWERWRIAELYTSDFDDLKMGTRKNDWRKVRKHTELEREKRKGKSENNRNNEIRVRSKDSNCYSRVYRKLWWSDWFQYDPKMFYKYIYITRGENRVRWKADGGRPNRLPSRDKRRKDPNDARSSTTMTLWLGNHVDCMTNSKSKLLAGHKLAINNTATENVVKSCNATQRPRTSWNY